MVGSQQRRRKRIAKRINNLLFPYPSTTPLQTPNPPFAPPYFPPSLSLSLTRQNRLIFPFLSPVQFPAYCVSVCEKKRRRRKEKKEEILEEEEGGAKRGGRGKTRFGSLCERGGGKKWTKNCVVASAVSPPKKKVWQNALCSRGEIEREERGGGKSGVKNLYGSEIKTSRLAWCYIRRERGGRKEGKKEGRRSHFHNLRHKRQGIKREGKEGRGGGGKGRRSEEDKGSNAVFADASCKTWKLKEGGG